MIPPLRPCGVCRKPCPGGRCPTPGHRYVPRRRARNYAGPVWRALRNAALDASGYRCDYCSGPAGTGDHVIPVSQGGQHESTNTVAACARCNTSKGDRTLSQWVHAGLAPEPAIALLAQRILDRLPV